MALNWRSIRLIRQTSSNLYLFKKIKNKSVTHFWTDDDILHAVEYFLNGQEKKFFKSGIVAPEPWLTHVMILKWIMMKNNAICPPEIKSKYKQETTHNHTLQTKQDTLRKSHIL